jgi:hypothetical protein
MYMASDIETIKMGNERIFDTLQYANKLKAVGVPEKQAEVQAETMVEIISNNLATKQDLELVKSELKRDILATNQNLELVKSELKRDILATNQNLELVRSELKRDILATNQNLELVKKEIDLKIELSKNELKQNLKELELRMTVKLGGLMVCGLSILVVLMKLFKL